MQSEPFCFELDGFTGNRLKLLGVCFCLLVLPILVMLFSTPSLASIVTNGVFNLKVQELITNTTERNDWLKHNIASQLSHIKFDCEDDDMEVLRDSSYYNGYVRFAGIQSSRGKRCSTLGAGLPIPDEVIEESSVAEYIISTTSEVIGAEQEFVVYVKHNDNFIYWVVNNSFIHDLLLKPCKSCFYLEYIYNGKGGKGIHVERGNDKIKYQENAISISKIDRLHGIELKVWAGEALRNYVTHQVRYYGLIFSSVLGVLLVILFLIFFNHNFALGRLLKSALKNKEFMPFYQPVVDSRTQKVVGFEALIRLCRGGKLISPDIFIDYAERQGLIMSMTTQVVNQVVADLHKISESQWISVNLVAAHVEQSCLQDMLKKLQWPDPKRLTFELTERIPISNVKAAIREIEKLDLRGYQFKLDDFGTGYGSFAYVQQLNISCIKIDKMFIDTIGTKDIKNNVLDAIITFGRESNLEMIAEGVETIEQLEYLFERGVYFIQGYVYAKPMPINQVLEWVSNFMN